MYSVIKYHDIDINNKPQMPKENPINNSHLEHIVSTAAKEYQECLDHLHETMDINILTKAATDQYNQGYTKGYQSGFADGYTKAKEELSQELSHRPTFPCIPDAPAEMLVDGQWVQGRIVKGYRFDDGIVTIETPTGERYWCGQDRTELYREIKE